MLPSVRKWVEYWIPFYTEFEDKGKKLGYWWYSDLPLDAAAVHNTSALVAMAAELLDEISPNNEKSRLLRDKSLAYFRLFEARLRLAENGAYVWNYCDDGMDESKRNFEDYASSSSSNLCPFLR